MSGLCFFADVDVVVLGVSNRAVCDFGSFLDFDFLDDDEAEAELENIGVVDVVVVGVGLGGCARPSRIMTRRLFVSADW